MFKILIFLFICLLLHARYKQGYSWKDIFSPTRWKAVYIWLLKKQLKFFGENEKYLTKNELLQYSYRVANCTDCLIEGKCVNCKCDSEGRINGTQDECSAGKWGKFLTDNEMDSFLKHNRIIFIVKTESNE
jgi:hypothetical protein